MAHATLGQVEQALLDVSRVALSGDVDGVRLLVRRYTRRAPSDASRPAELKEALLDILASAPQPESTPLRSAAIETNDASWVRNPSGVQEPVFSEKLGRIIRLLISEHLDPAPLAKFGLAPSKAVLFTGPSGVGKTLTAEYIASELSLPLITVNLASLISSLMGRTGQNLQDVLATAASQPCVVFFDEFDALAKDRSDSSDVGEVRRLVNVILQQLDRWPAGGLLLAATNHGSLLDSAVQRRFDASVQFGMPTETERLCLLSQNEVLAHAKVTSSQLELLAVVSEGWSHAELETWVSRTIRRAASDRLDEEMDIIGALLEGASETARQVIQGEPALRARLAVYASEQLHWSNRHIADWLGVTHPTIASDLRRIRATKGLKDG